MDSWITSTIESLGYFGVIALMFLENLFPPIPSEVVMPLSGTRPRRGSSRSSA
jgi:membrane protein DedA with SNARE-associated domain